MKKMNLDTFWKQPSKGFTELSIGRTEEQIRSREDQIGFKFPKSYRDLMKIQNGGHIRKSAFFYRNEFRELLYNGATIDKINPTQVGYQTMLDVLSEWKGEDEMNSLSPTNYNYLKRLPLISHMDGHAWMCFDYGWQEKNQRVEPEICFFNDEFKEYLRLPNFDKFLDGLTYFGYESCEYFFGLKTDYSIDQLANEISKSCNLEFKEMGVDIYGPFNFSKWYRGIKLIEDNVSFQFNLTPNRFQNETFLFQEFPELNCVIGITPLKDKVEPIMSNSAKFHNLMAQMLSDIDINIVLVDLLIPENVNTM